MTALLDADAELPRCFRHTLSWWSTKSWRSRRRSPASIASSRRSPARIQSRHAPDDPWRRCLTATRSGIGRAHYAFRRGRDSPVGWVDAAGIIDRRASLSGPNQQAWGRPSSLSPDTRRQAVLRVALPLAARAPDRLTRLQQWAVSIATHRGRHKATVAVANKLARIVWAVWHYDVAFEPQPRVA